MHFGVLRIGLVFDGVGLAIGTNGHIKLVLFDDLAFVDCIRLDRLHLGNLVAAASSLPVVAKRALAIALRDIVIIRRNFVAAVSSNWVVVITDDHVCPEIFAGRCCNCRNNTILSLVLLANRVTFLCSSLGLFRHSHGLSQALVDLDLEATVALGA